MVRLVLWDVDGTLIHTQGIGSEVFDRAFEQVLGLAPSARISERVRLSGKTDPQIALEYLELMGVTDPDTHLPLVLKILEAELATAATTLAANGGAFGGVAEVLARLAATDGVYQTLLTGNLAANALVKVAAFGLDQWLDLEIGAYGSDHADRCQLVPIAWERARRLRGIDAGPMDTWVVGDTERDLACARAGRARCLLVATGSTPLAELAALGPDAVMADLTDVDAVFNLLTAYEGPGARR
jgi:phosphoglycolate phosphatase